MTDVARTDFDCELRRHNDILSRACNIQPGERVLDIGCGTGQTTRQAARASRTGIALGIDVAGPSIETANRSARAAHIVNVVFEHADAQTYCFEASQFDSVISRFGTMFFKDPHAAFTNIGRALRPGGRLTMMVWQARERNEWIVTIDSALKATGATVVGASEALDPFSLADPRAVTEVLEAAGFTDVRFTDINEAVFYGVDIATAFDWILGFTNVSAVLDRLDDPAVEERFVGLIHEALAAHIRHDGVWFDSRAWIVSARRPELGIAQDLAVQRPERVASLTEQLGGNEAPD